MKNPDITDLVNDLVRSANALADEVRNLRFENARLKGGNRKRLSTRDIQFIREMHSNGLNQRAIAAVLDVNPSTVSRTIRGIYNANKR